MTALSIVALITGTLLLMFLPIPRSQLARTASKAGGTFLFGLGLGGVILGMMTPVA